MIYVPTGVFLEGAHLLDTGRLVEVTEFPPLH
jgi:hypothetical protein